MTRVKICGITSFEDAECAVEAGADALGFVFAASPRQISPGQARDIVRRLPPFVRTVGVFVDAPFDEVQAVATRAGVDVVQLHGQEEPGYCGRFSRTVLKRLAVSEDDTAEVLAARAASYNVSAVLLDPGAGSGRTFRWELARGIRQLVILAGGLTPENVAAAVCAVRPYGVDVASGVEESPGCKSPARVRAFIEEVRREDAKPVA